MRIGFNFHTTDLYISGVEHYSLGLLNALLRIDGKNEYFVFTNQPSLIQKYITPKENLFVKDLSFLKTRAYRILWEHLKLPKIAHHQQLDILHCPHYITPFFTNGLRCVVTIHDTIALDNPSWCKRTNAMYYNIMMGHTIKKALKVIAVSRSTAENIKRRFDITDSDITVIHPGIDSFFYSQPDYSLYKNIRSKFHLPEKYILFVGNIEPKKNLINLLKAYKLVKQKGLTHKLVFAGQRSWKSDNIWEYIKSNFIENEVIFIGYVEKKELPFVYKMADVFVFVSLCEGFGFPALEAMACGTAVVASYTGILREINEGSYAPVDPEDIKQIADAIFSLANDSNKRRQQIKIARKESAKFTWRDSAEKTLKVYMEAAGVYESANL